MPDGSFMHNNNQYGQDDIYDLNQLPDNADDQYDFEN